jgi:hypothetical protein
MILAFTRSINSREFTPERADDSATTASCPPFTQDATQERVADRLATSRT